MQTGDVLADGGKAGLVEPAEHQAPAQPAHSDLDGAEKLDHREVLEHNVHGVVCEGKTAAELGGTFGVFFFIFSIIKNDFSTFL